MKVIAVALVTLLALGRVCAATTFEQPNFNYPIEVDTRARVVLDSALQVGDPKLATQSLTQIALAKSVVSQYKGASTLALIDSVIATRKLTPDYVALLYRLEATLVEALRPGNDDKSAEIVEWSYAKKQVRIMELLKKSIDPLGNGDHWMLQQPIGKYEGILTMGDEYGRRCMPTLFDFLCTRAINELNKEEESALRKKWMALHANDADRLAAAYIESTRNYRYKNRTGDYIFEKYGKAEDLGLFLCSMNTSLKTEEEYIRLYPNSPFRGQIEADAESQKRKVVKLSYPKLHLTSDTIKVTVQFRQNATHCIVGLYRLPDNLPDDPEEGLPASALTLVKQVETSRLNGKLSDPKALFTPVPLGRYIAIAQMFISEGLSPLPDLTSQDLKENVITVSDLRSFDVTTGKTRRIHVIDGKTGEPVEGATVTCHCRNAEREETLTLTTDGQGAVSVDPNARIEFSCVKGDDKAAIVRTLYTNYRREIEEMDVDIFTDLAIYRPGETVQFSAIAYQQKGNQREVVRDTLLLFRFMTDSLLLRTDSYGAVSGEFVLPLDKRNGRYALTAWSPTLRNVQFGSHSIEMSEYKMPQYYLDLSATRTHQKKGRRMVVEGRLLSYTGMPVPNADVEVEFNSDYLSGLRCYDDEYADEYDCETRTDADGRFRKRVPFRFKLPWRGVSGYSVDVSCETVDGEEVEASTHITKGTQRRLFLSGGTFVLPDDGTKLSLPIWFRSSTGELPASVECTYTLYNNLGKKVKEGTFTAASPKFEWADLPSGRYRMKGDLLGRGKGFDEKIYLVRASDQKLSSHLLLWAPYSMQSVDSAGVAHLSAGTSFDTPIYYVAHLDGKEVASGWMESKEGIHKVQFQLPSANDASLHVTFYACHHGKQEEVKHIVEAPMQRPVSLRTVSFRDKITPGSKEHWSFCLLDAEGKPVAGRMMLELYDKALHDLASNHWSISPLRSLGHSNAGRSNFYNGFVNRDYTYIRPVKFTPYMLGKPAYNLWGQDFRQIFSGKVSGPKVRKMCNGFVLDEYGDPITGASVVEVGTSNGVITDIDGYFALDLTQQDASLRFSYIGYNALDQNAQPDMLVCLGEDMSALQEVVVVGYGTQRKELKTGSVASVLQGRVAGVSISGLNDVEALDEEIVMSNAAASGAMSEEEKALNQVAPRIGNMKVALWRPTIESDSLGNFTIDFDVANENTTWHLQALAYTSTLAHDLFNTDILAQRPLMVKPSLPRFLRAGDNTTLRAFVENATDSMQQITTTIELFDPRTDLLLGCEKFVQTVAAQKRVTLNMPVTAPYQAEALGVRVKAVNQRGDSDGEQQQIWILPATAEVTHTEPFYLKASETEVSLQMPVADIDSTSRLTLEYCNNPTWYCVEALPLIADADAVTSPGLAHTLYANAVTHKLRGDSIDFHSQIEKLSHLQNADGGFVWLSNGRSMNTSAWATSQVVELLGDLKQMDCLPSDSLLQPLIEKALQHLDRNICALDAKNRVAVTLIGNDSCNPFIEYAYLRSAFGADYRYENDSIAQICKRLMNTTLNTVTHSWQELDLAQRAFAAILLARQDRESDAKPILESLNQMAVHDAVRGMYWSNFNQSSYFHPVACTSLMLQAFAEAGPQAYAASVEEIRQWLLLEKQTSKWGNGSMAAHAVHALLLSGEDWLHRTGNETASSTSATSFTISIDGKDIPVSVEDEKKGLVTIDVPVSAHQIVIGREGGNPAWGALYHRHVLPIEQIQPDSVAEIKIRKELFVEKEEGRYVSLAEYGAPLKMADHVHVVLFITCGKDLDCLTLKDERPAFLEPKDYLSGYRWNWSEGGYYQEVKDACVNFYFDRLREGSHRFSYDCIVTQSGRFSAGISTIESNLAPQYHAHSEGCIVEVE